ncbi:MAG: PD-(D/E)XK nuclease family protein [Clostridia bacterium]
MLKIITGRSGSGKTQELLKLMKKSENAIYIVPEQYSFAAEKKITHAFKMGGMGNPSVYSLRRLAYYIEEKSGRKMCDDITPSGKIMMLSDIVRKLSKSLTLYGGAAKRGNMAEESAVIVTTLKEYNVTKEKMENVIEKTGNNLLKKKLSDCIKISEAYDAFLKEGYRDADDVLESLKRNIENTPYLTNREIFFDSFTAFTPLEFSVIESMMKRCKKVTVALCVEDVGDEFETCRRTKNTLIRIAKNLGIPYVEETHLKGAMYTATDEMKAIEKSFFEDEYAVFQKETDKVEIYCAKNEYNEAQAAARQVEKLCRDYGYRYRDIVIVARDMEDYEKNLQRAFEKFNIPLFMDKKTPLSGEVAAIFVAFAIKIISRGWRSENVFAYMKTAFSPLDTLEADFLEDYCIKAGVRAMDWKKEEDWTMKPNINENEEVDEDYLKRINQYRRKLTEPLLELERKIKGKHTGREFALAFYSFMEDCRLEEKIEEISETLMSYGQNNMALKMKQVYDLLLDILESFDSAFKNKTLSAEEFLSVIMTGMESVEIGIIPATTDCVCAGSIDRARGHGAKAVIIIGANEGKFPQNPKETGIFTDADKMELAKYGIELPPGNIGKIYMEESLLYGALTCATDRIYVSYNLGAEGASESVIVKRLRKIFPKCNFVSELEGFSDMERISGAKSTFEDFAVKFAAMAKGEEMSPYYMTALEYYKNEPFWKEKLAEIEKYTSYENKTEIIRRDLLNSRYGEGISTSVSRLEQFSKCPFSYFANVTLSLKDRKALEVTAADSGTFLHNFVDMFGKGLKEDNRTWRDADKEYIDKKADEITPALLDGVNKHLIETSPRVRQLFVQLKRIAKKSVTMLSEHMKKGSFEPLGYEIVFDEKGKFKPVKIELPTGQTVKLRGRIDRADLLETSHGKYVRIIDYKSGSKSFSLANIYYGFDLQLGVYLDALCENGGYKSAGMLYFKISDPVISGSVDSTDTEINAQIEKNFTMDGLVLAEDEILEAMDINYAQGSTVVPVKKKTDGSFTSSSSVATEGEFKAIRQNVSKTVKKLAGAILDGVTDIKPVRGACDWCSMKALCGFDTTVTGCSYRYVNKISDRDALLKMVEEETQENCSADS